MPVAAATHTCKDKAKTVELGLPLVAAKKFLSFIEHLVPREVLYLYESYFYVQIAPFMSIQYVPLWPHFPFTYHFLALFFPIYFSSCAKPFCFYPRSQFFKTLFPCLKEDCAWIRTVIYLYSTVYLSTILNFVVTKWTSCAVYGAVLSHIVSNLCAHYWFVIVRSVINPISYLMTFPQIG